MQQLYFKVQQLQVLKWPSINRSGKVLYYIIYLRKSFLLTFLSRICNKGLHKSLCLSLSKILNFTHVKVKYLRSYLLSQLNFCQFLNYISFTLTIGY